MPRLVSFWPILLLAGFASAYIPLVPMLGYRWLMELALASFILVGIFAYNLRSESSWLLSSGLELRYIVLPIFLFIVWSSLSVFWSLSWRGAIHHTLLWGCYLVFYLFVRQELKREGSGESSIKILGGAMLAISIACLAEYISLDVSATNTFNERYYPVAEMLVTLLPLFVAYKVHAERKLSRVALFISVFAWAAVVATTSRAMFIAGTISLTVLVIAVRQSHGTFERSKRWIVAFGALVIITGAFILPFRTTTNPTLTQRLSGNEEWAVKSAESRKLLWGLALEGFLTNPILGIGADNYFSDYKTLRESFSSSYPLSPTLGINEELLPERAHNEYLQILSELGIVGGLLFGWLLLGVIYMFWLAYKRKASLVTFGALSGMVAFLVASGASSYSFRFPANGTCFFFLLAVASKELFGAVALGSEEQSKYTFRLDPALAVFVSVAMISFCIVRMNSVRHLTNAMNAHEASERAAEIDSAIDLDPTEPAFRFFKGQLLASEGRYEGAIPELRLAIDNGWANSTSFYRLTVAQQRAGNLNDAEETLQEALRVFPRSVFLKTAYSTFLNTYGETGKADLEFESALTINEKQARSWQLAHNEGLEKLVHKARIDSRYVSPFDLVPADGPLAMTQ